jgi:cytochrome c556
MIRIVLVTAVAAIGVSAVVAQTDPIAARKALMKANGEQNKIATGMLDGKQPFDLAAAKKVFATFAEAGTKGPALFPPGSDKGDTAALPAIWEKKADFDAIFAKLAKDSQAGAAATTDLASFKAQIGTARANCGACHKVYRKKS